MKSKKELLLGFSAFIYSITLLFVLINSFASYTTDRWEFFYKFTYQSNIIVLIWLVLFGLTVFFKTPFEKFIRNKNTIISITVYISITYFIVALVLEPIYKGAFNPVSDAGELWTHHLTPIVMWFMYFLVKGTGTSTIKQSLVSLIYPIIYFIANLIIGATVNYANGKPAYAYDFISPNAYGGNYLILFIVIVVLLLIFSAFTIGLNKFKNYIDTNYHTELA